MKKNWKNDSAPAIGSPSFCRGLLDEIQSCERALMSLKMFCEEAPEYRIAAAGSLLGVAINREKYSFPVGKVHELTLYPLDFEEFLWANGDEIYGTHAGSGSCKGP